MNKSQLFLGLGLVLLPLVALAPPPEPYIGFVYPAGGQQGATFQVTVGGQFLDGVKAAFVSGPGVQARLVEYNKHMGNQEVALLKEQLNELNDSPARKAAEGISNLIAKLDKIVDEYVDRPQCVSIANLAIIEITIAPEAEPGAREIRLVTARGISNPLVFHVGQIPEISAPAMPSSPRQVLGKEAESLRGRRGARKRRDRPEMMMMAMDEPRTQSALDEKEVRVTLPCTVNGQISSGTVDRFRFAARKGQKLVILVRARELAPYIADAVPGWFQPVLALYDAKGREVAYADDYYFKPDPVILFEVPADGDYMFEVYDAIYRGREDFIYRISIGELPFVMNIFPLGGQVDAPLAVAVKGWNLLEKSLKPDTTGAAPGVYPLSARGRNGLVSNRVLFAMDALPECLENELNNTVSAAQKVTLPIIVNGRIDRPGAQDVFQFEGRTGDRIVAEVYARALDSPLDSALKLTDAAGKGLAFNDDHEDVCAGLNTHPADSYICAALPAKGVYYVHLSDAQHKGGEEYAYRLRISAPRPDFALRVVPSSVNIRGNSAAAVSVYAVRRDGCAGNIRLELKNAPAGFEMKAGNLKGTQEMARVHVKTSLGETREPVSLIIEGRMKNGEETLVHAAVPAEDRMQAFLWRHLVPAQELKAFVYPPPPSQKPSPPKQPAAPKP